MDVKDHSHSIFISIAETLVSFIKLTPLLLFATHLFKV